MITTMKYILEHIYAFPGNVKNIFKVEIHYRIEVCAEVLDGMQKRKRLLLNIEAARSVEFEN